jgi:hypothetical protein
MSTAPTLRSVGAAAAGTGSVTPAMPDHAIGTVLLLAVESSNETVTLSSAHSFSQVSSSGTGTGTAATGTAVRLTTFWVRATSAAMPAPTISDPGNHALAVISAYDGCIESGIPWDVTAGNVVTPTSSTVSIRGATTSVNSCLVVAISSVAKETSVGQFSNWVNANLSDVSSIVNAATNIGNGGCLGIAIGSRVTAGSYGTTTAALGSSDNTGQHIQANMSIALMPPEPPPPDEDPGSGTSQNPVHTYAQAGTYTVRLTVTDNDGLSSSTTGSVTVA